MTIRTIIQPSTGWPTIGIVEIWRYRELLWILAVRDIKVRYAQSLLGVAWAILQPLGTMVVFSVLFSSLLGNHAPTVPGVPYAVSTFCALVPWQLFARALSSSATSVVANQSMITKVYFPRVLVALAPVLSALLDFSIALLVLLGIQIAHGIYPGWSIVALPFFTALAVVAALALSLWLSALNALYRDVAHVVPFLLQMLMFVSPVVYSSSSILVGKPTWVRFLYVQNPLAGSLEGFRWALLGTAPPPGLELLISVCSVLVLFTAGLFYFRWMERTIVDLV